MVMPLGRAFDYEFNAALQGGGGVRDCRPTRPRLPLLHLVEPPGRHVIYEAVDRDISGTRGWVRMRTTSSTTLSDEIANRVPVDEMAVRPSRASSGDWTSLPSPNLRCRGFSSSKVPITWSENVSMPQLVRWMTNHSRVPSSLVESPASGSRHRSPGLRHCGSHGRRLPRGPAYLAGSSRASMQVRMAKCRAGGMASLPFRRNWRIGCWLLGRRQTILWTWSLTLNTGCAANILTTSGKCQRNEISL